jgi:hypothetical protein
MTLQLNRSLGSQKVQSERFRNLAHESGKVDSPKYRPLLSLAHTPGTHLRQKLSGPKDYNVAGNIKAMKNTNDSIGNRYRDLPACSAVPQPTAPLQILKPVQLLNCLCGANN